MCILYYICIMFNHTNLYRVNQPRNNGFVNRNENVNMAAHECKAPSVDVWHQRYGHLNHKYLETLMKNELVHGMDSCQIHDVRDCEACVLGKMTRRSFPKKSQSRASKPLEIIHSDLCGPMQVDSIGGSRYVLSFIDDFSRYATVYFLKQKSEVLEKFKNFVQMVEKSMGERKIKNLCIWNNVKAMRSDSGGEYSSAEFTEFCATKGISHQFTNPYSPEQNGVAERFNRTLIESVRSMILHANVPLNLWAEAVNTSVYVHNRSPTVALDNQTPYECWFQKKPDVSNLRVFGCVCYYHIPSIQRKKLDPKSRKAIFVGYPADTKGYKLYDIESMKFKRKEIQNVIFHESEFHRFEDPEVAKEKINNTHFIFPITDEVVFPISQIVPSIVEPAPAHENETVNIPHAIDENIENIEQVGDLLVGRDNVVAEQIENRYNNVQKTYEETFMREVSALPATRLRNPNPRYLEDANIMNEIAIDMEKPLISDIDAPKSVNDALKGPNAVEWKAAMDREYQSLMKNKTWTLVPRPKDTNVVGNRWVYTIKRDAYGNITKFKGRLVAQGYSQTHGVDYDEVFSPVVRFATLRTLLALANANDWEIHQMDVTTAYLNGELDCDVYMEQPIGFVDLEHSDYVCKLGKSLYGLKQSARCWNSTLDKFLKSSGFRQIDADHCIYIKLAIEDGKFVIFAVYVDDIVPVSNDVKMLCAEKEILCKEYEMVDNGEADFFLNLVIKRNRNERTLSISHPSYLQGILKRFRMEDCNPVGTPMETGTHFVKRWDDEPICNKQLYQQAVGCLTYASVTTRPDISSAIGILSQFMSDPSEHHWRGIKRTLRYIKGTLNYGLQFSDNETQLIGFADADWAGDLDTRCSTSGHVFQVGNATVSWSSKRQKTVARSSTEAEYVALSNAAQEAIWLRCLLVDMNVDIASPTVIYEDNNGAIELSKNAKNHNRTKHIDIAYHFVRERVHSGELSVIHCPTAEMTADIMTKGLPKIQFQKLRDAMGVCGV